jgi:hypothetical protein
MAQPARHKASVSRDQLSTIDLGFSTREQRPVGKVCKVGGRRFACGDGSLEQPEAPPLKGRIPVGMLRQQPRCMRSFFSRQRAAGPAGFIDDLCKPRGIIVVNCENPPEGCLTTARHLGSGRLIKIGAP